MKKLLFAILFLATTQIAFSQNEVSLAYQYYRSGEYEKALPYFKKLYQKHTYSNVYFSKLISCYKQLKQFSEAEKTIEWQFRKHRQQHLWVYLGSIYQLQGKPNKAEESYQKAISAVKNNPNLANYVGSAFSEEHLLEKALLTYKTAMEYGSTQNFYYKLATVYAEMGNIEKMFDSYLNAVEGKGGKLSVVKRYMGSFVTDDEENSNNKILQKLLLKRLQNNPEIHWNQLLAWLFMQQHNYNKALIQQKALFKRNVENLRDIANLGLISFENKEFSTAKECFHFVISNTADAEQKLKAEIKLLDIAIARQKPNNKVEEGFQKLLNEYGINKATIDLQIAYANFTTFQKDEPQKAIKILKEALQIPSSKFIKGNIKNKLADVLVFTNKFNSALIHYTQVQNDLKNYAIAQESRYKIALTSYFKGDFQWAKAQVKVLKSATSKLIANDALELFLLITNNTEKDSLQTNLKKYAKADLLAFQNKNKSAIDSLQQLLQISKDKPIQDDALYKQARLFEKENEFQKAEANYLKIVELEKSNLKDDAIYHLAELYFNQLEDTKKALNYYKRIIFTYPSSIYLVDSRKKYRKLRGVEENAQSL